MELTPHAIFCGRCRRFGGVVLEKVGLSLVPRGWDYKVRHDCGMTGYSRTDLLCDSCLLDTDRTVNRPARVTPLDAKPCSAWHDKDRCGAED